MKKLSYISLFFMLCSSLVGKAQFQFNDCNVQPAFGDSLIGSFDEYDSTGIISGAGGANVVWDYSNMIVKYTWPIARTYYDPAATNGTYRFPNATLADSTQYGLFSYYTYSQDSISFLGDYVDSFTFHSSWDPRKDFKCNLTFGNSFTDFFSRYNFSQCPYHHTYSNRTITYDGYGTLILPSGSFNTARLKIVENTLDTAICNGPDIIKNTIDTTYLWYDTNTNLPLLFWHYFNDTLNAYTNIVIESYTYSHVPAMVAASIGQEDAESVFNVYPNPSNGIFEIEFSERFGDNFELIIYNMYSQKVYRENKGHRNAPIDISYLPRGVYCLKIKNELEEQTCKIILSK